MYPVIKLEAKKILNRDNILIGCIFLLICLVKIFPYSQSLDMVTGEGDFCSGVAGWSQMKEEGMAYDGVLNQDHMRKVRDLYNSSKDKPFVEQTRSDEGDLGLRLMFPFQWLANSMNFPYGELGMQDFSINLSDQQIDTFYQNRLEGIKEFIGDSNGSYNDQEIDRIMDKASKVKTPFYYEYNEGWRYLGEFFEMTFYIFLIYLVFVLSSSMSQDSKIGLREMDLSTKKGRLGLYLSKVRAGQIFGTMAYLFYLLFLLLYNLMVYSLHGAHASLEFIDSPAIFNLSSWQAFAVQAFVGFWAMLAMVNIIVLFSVLFKRNKVTLFILGLFLIWVNKWSHSMVPWASILTYFTPQNFVTDTFSIFKVFVLGNQVLPYGLLGICLSLIYIAISRILAMPLMDFYYLKGGGRK